MSLRWRLGSAGAGWVFTGAFVALTMAGGCAPASGKAARAPDGSRPDLLARLPDGRRLDFRCRGRGGPVVVFESGWAATSMAWTKVQDLTSARRMTCAYDRAGYGFSDPGPMPRDATAITDDLEAGLKAARIPAPYILVGHSAGGLYVRLFAARHPEQVAAMVLVDPSVVHQTARFDEVFGPGAATIAPLHDRTAACLAAAVAGRLPSLDSTLTRCTPVADPTTPAGREILAEARRPTMLRAELSEIDTIFSTASDEVAAAEPARIVQPVVVLTAGGDYAGSSDRDSAAGQLWARLHDEIAAKSDRGASRMVAHSSHLMMLDRPDVVAQAIEDSIAAAHR